MSPARLAITSADLAAFDRFRRLYPTWWWRLGSCDRSRDFTAGPQPHSPEHRFAEPGNPWDMGFMCDHGSSLADAIEDVLRQIREAAPAARGA